MAAQRYRKKPVEIEAMQFDGSLESGNEIATWAIGDKLRFTENKHHGLPHTLYINTPEGVMTASEGDWIIKGVAGEFYPCKPDIFAATYEKV